MIIVGHVLGFEGNVATHFFR